MRGQQCWLHHLGNLYISYLGIVCLVQATVFGGNIPVHSHKSQELASCVQLPALFLSRESATLEHWSFSALQFPRTILTLNAHGLCSARLDVQATYIPHISPRKRSPTANIILPTQSGSDSLIHIMSHTHNCQFCIKEKHWHIASSCTHY